MLSACVGILRARPVDPMVAVVADTIACIHCGALNSSDFGTCIRCGHALDRAVPAEGAARRVPAPRRPAAATFGSAGERLLGRWTADELPATKAIVALNMVVFAAHLITAYARDPSLAVLLTGGNQLDALRFGAMPRLPVIFVMEPWRVITACFVHFGAIHIGMNMLSLVHLGRLAEPAVGSLRYFLIYVASGIAGFVVNLAWLLVAGGVGGLTAGASGAVFGVVGLILGFLMRRRDPRWKAWLGYGVLYSLGFTLLLPAINHAAHLGGLVSGALLGALVAKGAPKPSPPALTVVALITALGCIAALAAVQFSPLLTMLSQNAPPD
jgi:membrane associated rhomboid family serine protease